VAQKVGRGIALLFHDHGARRGEWSAARPGRTLPPGKTRYPLYRRLCEPHGRSGRAENLAPPGLGVGIEPENKQQSLCFAVYLTNNTFDYVALLHCTMRGRDSVVKK